MQTALHQQQIANNQEQIDANQQEIQAAHKRFSELSEYDTKGEATVNFAVGSDAISAKDKAALTQLAQSAVSLTGYIIQVKGFADSSGNAAMNQQLSMDRHRPSLHFCCRTVTCRCATSWRPELWALQILRRPMRPRRAGQKTGALM